MKEQKHFLPDRLAVYGGLGLLLVLGLCALLLRQDFSAWERRNLTGLPQSVSLTDWTLNDDLEDELSDQVPGRRLLVNLYAEAQALTGRAQQLEAWPEGEYFLEQPVSGSAEQAARRVAQLKELAGEIPCLFLVPPSNGILRMNGMPALVRSVYAKEEELYNSVTKDDCFVPVRLFFSVELSSEPPLPDQFYYRTDHHWTLDGAYLAYRAFCKKAGLTPADLSTFTLTEYQPFYGTTYSRSGLPFAKADTLRCAEPSWPVTLSVPAEGIETDHLIFPEEAETYDGYAVYLKGNHGVLEIRSPEAETEETLVVFKDSFANCFLPFLTRHYARIIAADARYMEGSFRDVLADARQADRILYLYSLDSLVNDTAITRKLR